MKKFKTLSINYLENNCTLKINTIGYSYNPNNTDSYGTKGGATYYIMPNNYIYRITPTQYELQITLRADLFDYNGDLTTKITKYLCNNSYYWKFKNNSFIRTFTTW
mgnify:FL=1